jgi:pimeloyl-ACP methyl ester carboxylesterase
MFSGFRKNQMELAQRSTQGKLVIVENSGHHIPHDQPGVVVDAIRDVVTDVRRKTIL